MTTLAIRTVLDNGIQLKKLINSGIDFAWLKSELQELFHCKCKDITRFLDLINDNDAYGSGFDVSCKKSGSYKYLPALFELMATDLKEVEVYTTGNWGISLQIANRDLEKNIKLNIHEYPDDPQYYNIFRQNVLNTDTMFGEWGVRQALSVLPAPSELRDRRVWCRMTQGNLANTLVSMGYKLGKDIFIKTDCTQIAYDCTQIV